MMGLTGHPILTLDYLLIVLASVHMKIRTVMQTATKTESCLTSFTT